MHSKTFADSLVVTPLAAGMASQPRPGIPAQPFCGCVGAGGLVAGSELAAGAKWYPQCLHTLASAITVSAQSGHFLGSLARSIWAPHSPQKR